MMKLKNSLVLMLCAISFPISSCKTIPIVPDRVSNSEISFDGNNQNAGVIDFVKGEGWRITDNAAKKYLYLSEKYGHNLRPPIEPGEGLIEKPEWYVLTHEYMIKFAVLNQIARQKNL